MEQIKFKNSLLPICVGACFVTELTVFCCVFCVLMTYFLEDARDFTIVLIVSASVIAGIWIIAGLLMLLQSTVVVTEEEIKLCRGKKNKWSIDKEEIKECLYSKARWYDFFIPISPVNASMLKFKLKDGSVIARKKYCFLTSKQVKMLRDKFDYPLCDIE